MNTYGCEGIQMPLNVDEMGSALTALEIIMQKARAAIYTTSPLPYAREVKMYTAGYESLHQSWPTFGWIGW